MATPDKVEAVKKTTETLSKSNSVEELERVSANKDQFDSFMNSSQAAQSAKPTSFERIDPKAFGIEEVQTTENKPIFAEESASSQKSGTATDQEQKRHRQQDNEVEGIGATGSKQKAASANSSSLMDEVSKLNKNAAHLSSATPASIKAQAKDVIAQIDKAKTQLSQTQTEIKPSYQTLLKNRLTHVDDHLKIALNKAGVEYQPSSVSPKENAKNPAQKFLNMLTNSENQLNNINLAIDDFNVKGQISPVNMLAIQVKLGYIQQQIELFTNLLNKALESTKTIMNVQV